MISQIKEIQTLVTSVLSVLMLYQQGEAALLVSTQGASTCLNIIGTIISLTSTQHYSH